ncbi:MAG: YfiR family protein [Acidobacteriota bacterium]
MLFALPSAQAQIDRATDVTVMAAYLYNFVKFTDWTLLGLAEPVTLCVIGDTRLAGALIETVRGKRIDGHPIGAQAIGGDASLQLCNVLFISKSAAGRSAALLEGLKRVPVLTVSDSKGFAQSMGIIEFFVDSERLRFAINKTRRTARGWASVPNCSRSPKLYVTAKFGEARQKSAGGSPVAAAPATAAAANAPRPEARSWTWRPASTRLSWTTVGTIAGAASCPGSGIARPAAVTPPSHDKSSG